MIVLSNTFCFNLLLYQTPFFSKKFAGLKSKVRDHYHAHRLSLWQQLLPRMQMQGKHETEQLLNRIRQLSGNGLMPNLTAIQQSRLFDTLLDSLHRNNHPANMAASQQLQLQLLQQQLDASGVSASGLADVMGFVRSDTNMSAGSALTRRANQTSSSGSSRELSHEASLTNGSANNPEFAGAMLLSLLVGLVLLTANLFVFLAIYVQRQKKRKRLSRYASNSAVVATHTLDGGHSGSSNSQGHATQSMNTTSVGTMSSEKQQLAHSASLVGFTTPQSAGYAINGPPGSLGVGGFYFTTTSTGNPNSTASNAPPSVGNTNPPQLLQIDRSRINYGDYCCDEQHLCLYNDVATVISNASSQAGSSVYDTNGSNVIQANVVSASANGTAAADINKSVVDHVTCLASHGMSAVCNCGHCEPMLASAQTQQQIQQHNHQQQQQQQMLSSTCRLVGLVTPNICDTNNCNLSVIHEFDEHV